MKEFTAAGIQIAYDPDNKERLVKKAIEYLRRARGDHGADLAVFPESITTGFDPGMSAADFYRELDGIPGRDTEAVQEAARELGICVLWPIYEKGPEGVIYNSAALFDASGNLAAKYRKTHPFPTERLEGGGWTTPGTEITVCQLPFAKVGIIICYDGDFPELSRALALEGAEVILRPSALLRSSEIWEMSTRARSYDNHVYMVSVNALGRDRGGSFCFGHSMIVSPIGQITALGRCGEEIVYSTLNPDPIKTISYGTDTPQKFDHLEDRNVESYRTILKEGRSPFEPSLRIPYRAGK